MLALTLWTTRVFPLAALGVAGWAWAQPGLWAPGKPAIVPLLSVVMLGMGLTLRPADFARAVRDWPVVGLGVGAQYLVMPVAALGLSRLFGLGPMATLGVVLVGSCPGGTASNVITYLARGRVALSITMTLASTVVALFATPWLTWLYAGHTVPVPVWGLFLGVLKIVIGPVALGVLLNRLWPRAVGRLRPVWPGLSMLAILWIIGIVVALNAPRLATVALGLLAVVVLHNAAGFAAGYGAGALIERLGPRRPHPPPPPPPPPRPPQAPDHTGKRPGDGPTRRTLSIEVGMQNSGLAAALAAGVFPDHPEVMLAAALFSVWQNVAGSALAGFWRASEKPEGQASASR